MTTYAGFRPPDRSAYVVDPPWVEGPFVRVTHPLSVLARSIAMAGRCVCPVIVGKSGEPNRPQRLGRPGIGTSSACAGCGGYANGGAR